MNAPISSIRSLCIKFLALSNFFFHITSNKIRRDVQFQSLRKISVCEKQIDCSEASVIGCFCLGWFYVDML